MADLRNWSVHDGDTDTPRLRAFLANHRVKVVILDPTHDDGWLPVLARAGLTPHRRDGVLVYPVSAARP